MKKQDLLCELYFNDIIKYEPVVLKSGEKSNFYINARSICANPELFSKICNELVKLIRDNVTDEYDCICGVPMGGITFSVLVAKELNKPLTYLRKEKKEHGLGKDVEGYEKSGATCVMIEDVISTGSSFIENRRKLIDNGFNSTCTLISVFIRKFPYHYKELDNVYSLFTPDDIKEFHKNWMARLIKKSKTQTHQKSIKLINYALEKKTNICLSLDLEDSDEILKVAEELGDKICMLKLHCDIITNKSHDFFGRLNLLAETKKFVLCEDRKFSDIGNTMLKQFTGGEYSIDKYFDFVTIHAISGYKSLEVMKSDRTALMIVTEMSSQGNLMSDYYQKMALGITKQLKPYASGIVSQQNLSNDLLTFTPGISIKEKTEDDKGQRYNTPVSALERGSDFLIVGRSIYQAENPREVIDKILEYKI